MRQPRTRTRPRHLDVEAEGPQPTPEMVQAAINIFNLNQEKNAASRQAEGLKKKLTSMVSKVPGLTRFFATTGGRQLEVTYGQGTSEKIDGAKLFALVGDIDRVLALATFSKDAVKEEFGSNVAAASTVEKKGDFKLGIKEVK